MVGILINEGDSVKLKSLGVKDSKLLKHEERLELEKGILKIVKGKKIIVVEPAEIDKAVEGVDGLNLNWLEARKTAEILNVLNPEKAVLDCPSRNLKAYENYIREYLDNKNMELSVEHKADMNHVCVGAASILAKNKREKEVAKIEKKVGQSIGSGYMTNPICQEFVKENFEKYPEVFRKSWATIKRQIEEKKQKKIGEY